MTAKRCSCCGQTGHYAPRCPVHAIVRAAGKVTPAVALGARRAFVPTTPPDPPRRDWDETGPAYIHAEADHSYLAPGSPPGNPGTLHRWHRPSDDAWITAVFPGWNDAMGSADGLVTLHHVRGPEHVKRLHPTATVYLGRIEAPPVPPGKPAPCGFCGAEAGGGRRLVMAPTGHFGVICDQCVAAVAARLAEGNGDG